MSKSITGSNKGSSQTSKEQFLKEYREDDGSIKRFKVLSRASSGGLFAVYLYAVVIGLVLSLLTYTIFGIESDQFGIADFTQLVIIGLALIGAFGIVRVFSNKRKELGYSQQKVAYHYLASAIYEYENGPNYGKLVHYLSKFKKYCGVSNNVVLPPKCQEELISYISHVENREGSECNGAIDKCFEQNMNVLIDGINYVDDLNLTIPTQEDDEDATGPSTPRILIEALVESITLDRMMFISAISIVAVAMIGYRLGGPQVAALILTSFSIIQAIISLLDGNKTD